MAMPAPSEPAALTRVTVERYFGLFEQGLLDPDERVELLGGVVVGMSPPNPPHDAVVSLVNEVLVRAVGDRAAVRCQCSLVIGAYSVPQPDVAVVRGRHQDYLHAHPRTALLVVEVADSSLAQDRLTKAMLYAAADVPEYWIVDLRHGRIEMLSDPEPAAGRYRERKEAVRGDRVSLVALPAVQVAVDDVLPDPAAMDAETP